MAKAQAINPCLLKCFCRKDRPTQPAMRVTEI